MPVRHEVLFVGNSFVHVNDVAGHYRTIAGGLFDSVRVEEVSPGGYRWEQHADDARIDGTQLARWLRTGTPEETSFDAVVLQEQSQIGGFPAFLPARKASIAGASELAALARARGARVVLYLTWGYKRGDPSNSLLGFGTYAEMQDRLDEQYLGLAALLREQGSTVQVAPVGGGFRLVFEDLARAGADPLAEGSDFDALYEPDGMHPSLRGAYLASCIIAGTITGADVRSFVIEPTLGQEVSNALLDVCARALKDPRWHAPTIQRSADVLAGDGSPYGYFGAAVAISSDGSRVMAGAPSLKTPSARVFARADAGWTEEALWGRDAGMLFGSSVALSADGTRALAGPPSSIMLRADGTWRMETTLSPGPAPSNPETTGFVALSADGARAIISEGSGWPRQVRVPVFVRNGVTWTEEDVLDSAEVYGPGPAVHLDGSGQRAILSAYADRPARIYVRSSSGWTKEADLSSSGSRVALSADGTRAIVGEPLNGRAIIYVRVGASWGEEDILRGSKSGDFGQAVSLSGDGRRALVGAPRDAPVATGEASGSVHVYGVTDRGFRHELLLVPQLPLEGDGIDQFGRSVAMSPDGRNVVVGAPGSDTTDGGTYVGAAHTFTLP